ncbi:TonB-dependent siderophore receptor, partial [Pseudomonas aeruginosa]
IGEVRDYVLSSGVEWELGCKLDVLDGRARDNQAYKRIVRRDFSVPDPNNPKLSVPVGKQCYRGIEGCEFLLIYGMLLAEVYFSWVD